MNSVSLEFPRQVDEAEIPLSLSNTLTIPPELPLLPVIENKTQEVHEFDDRKPKLKTEKTEGVKEPSFMTQGFPCDLNKFAGNFDVNAIPGLLTAHGQSGTSGQNSFDNFNIPQSSTKGSLMAPIDVRTLLAPGNPGTKFPADVGGPVDIRDVPSNEYNDYIMHSESLFDIRGVGPGGKKKEKSLAGLPAKLQELGVSKRLSKLERLIRMDESTMTRKQRSEKARLMRLEKNRRAAAVSRERKKRYVRSLEERSLIMSKHLQALELENSQLRKLLSQYNVQNQIPSHSVLPSLPSLEPLPLSEGCGLTSIENGKQASASRNEIGGSENKLFYVEDELLAAAFKSKKRGRKRKNRENTILNSVDIW